MWGQGISESNPRISRFSAHRLHGTCCLLITSCFILVIVGCGGGGSSTDSSSISDRNDGIGSGGTSESPSGTGAVALSWIPPTTNTDGTALEDLAGYRLYYGISTGKYPEMIDINNPGLSSYVVENLSSDIYYFVATAYDANGNESPFSNEAFVTITE